MKNKLNKGRRVGDSRVATSEMFEPRVLLSTTYDAAKDFSLGSNPNGPWSYGVRASLTADYAPFVAESALDFGTGASGWSESSGSPPYVGINTTGSEYDSEGIKLPTGVLAMHPGINGEYADVRFTVPVSGIVKVDYDFAGIDTNGTTTDVHILYNGVSKRDSNIDDYGISENGLITLTNAAVGDILDFEVGTGSNKTFYSDCTSFEAQITTTATNDNHLVFSQQPKDGNERTPEPTQVKIENSKNQLVTTATDGVTLSLRRADGTTRAVGFAAFNHGVASFTGANAPVIPAGDYSFVAVETDAAGETSGTAGQVTSTSFHNSLLHLAFTRQPAFAGAGQPFTVAVELEDDKNRVVKIPEANPAINLIAIDTKVESNETQFRLPFVNGKPMTITIADPGTYEITASQIDPATGQPVDFTTNATSAPLVVLGNHFRFIKQPGNVGAGQAVAFMVGLFDYKNKPISSKGLTGVFRADIDNESGAISSTFFTFTNGKYNNLKPTGSPLLALATGSFTIQVTDSVLGTDNEADGIAPLTSLSFKVVTDHFVFKRQPATATANTPISFTIAVEDFKNKIVQVIPNGGFPNIQLAAVTGTGVVNRTADPYAPYASLDNGVYDNLTTGQNAPFEITSAGTYTFTVSMVGEELNSLPDYLPVTSKVFKITG